MRKTFRNNTTTIVLSRETRNKLAGLGTKDSTFDSIIQWLIEEVEENG